MGNQPAFDSELPKHVPPPREEAFLFTAGLDGELGAGDRHDRGEGVSVPVPDGTELATGTPVDAHDVQPG
jgi:hypothetical protein